uniref:Ig-like domain-containing protein n=1 Tax=Mesocestoides corti TaxID=53468 RepID=A0A5K3F5H7_MESCO
MTLACATIFTLLVSGIQAGLAPFRVVPQNLSVDLGATVYQACQPSIKPDFINWYVNNKLIGGCLLHSMSISSKTSDPRYKIYMSQEDQEAGISVCYLVVRLVEDKDSGVWTCKSSHPDSNIHEVSSRVLVYDRNMHLNVFLQNGTLLQDRDTVRAVCSARGSRRPPSLRLMFGGEPIATSEPIKKIEKTGEFNVSVTADLALNWKSHLRLLTCHADIGDFKNVRQTFLVVHLAVPPEKTAEASLPNRYLLWVHVLDSFKKLFFQ